MVKTLNLTADRLVTVDELEALYGAPVPRSLAKEINHISVHYRMFIEKAPFVVLATSAPEGLDCSPRGDPPGFVRANLATDDPPAEIFDDAEYDRNYPERMKNTLY
jgi:hypothetical protein